jgi:alpha-tubulin suppressor-like RCC1 family protein
MGTTCGVVTDGRTVCWGSRKELVPVVGLTGATAVASGEGHACAIDGAAAIWCWGDNRFGALGIGKIAEALAQSTTPVRVAGARRYRALSAFPTGGATCALDDHGTAWCWGMNENGQLGAPVGQRCGVQKNSAGVPCAIAPMAVSSGLHFTQISLGAAEGCGVTTGGQVYCWGTPEYLDTETTKSLAPRLIVIPR